MRFGKVLMIDIEQRLDKSYMQKLRQDAENAMLFQKDSPEIMRNLKDANSLLISFNIKVDKSMMDSAPLLKYIGVLGTGYEKVDFEYAKSKNITVTNVPGYSAESVAEFVIAVILEHIRDLERGKAQARQGIYSEDGFSASEIKGKTFGILGLGRIGGRIAEIALGFGADVRYWSRNRKSELEARGIKYESADSLVPNSDFLSLNFAQAAETKNFLNAGRIDRIKKGAIVVNTAPMSLVDMNALEKRLTRGDITFILDHSDELPPEELKMLSKYKSCIIYPPIAYISKEAAVAKQEIFAANIENFLKGKPSNKVN